MWTILAWQLAPYVCACLFSSVFVSLVVRLCTSVSICIIVFRVEEILVGAVYRLLLCIAQSVCGGPGASPNSLQGAAASLPLCHSDPPSGAQPPRSLTHFQKLRRDLHLQEIRPLMCQGNPWLPNSRPKTRAPHRMWIGLGLKCNHQSLQLLPGSPLREMKWINV